MSLGARLRQARESKKLSAKELSALSGVPEKTIYRIETGEVTDPRLSSIKPLLSTLECNANTMIFDEDEVSIESELQHAFADTKYLPEEEKRFLIELLRRWTMIGHIDSSASNYDRNR